MKQFTPISVCFIILMICHVIPSSTLYISVEGNLGTSVIVASEISSLQTKLEDAAFYLRSMYNSKLGLVANSEDIGPNPTNDSVPCTDTYWVYSDNLWAGYALQPFYPEIADNITDTVQQYIKSMDGLCYLKYALENRFRQ